MKKFFKKYIRSFISLFKYISLLKYKPYKLKDILFPDSNYSDFFIYDTECYKNIFITENFYGLLEGKKVNITHIFRFFNKSGGLINEISLKKSNLIDQIDLPKLKSASRYLSFTHHIEIKKNYINKNHERIIMHSRGYTKYLYEKNSIGTMVHGNFGAISRNKLGAAQRRNKFCYTPIINFKEKNIYQLVFNNPTNKKLKIDIISFKKNSDFQLRESLLINKYGTDFIKLEKFKSNISFISKMPVCRCLVFKNAYKNSQDPDVYHS